MREYLVRLREQRNESQQDVANAIGVSRQYYAMIECGERQKKMDVTLLTALATHFGMDVLKSAYANLYSNNSDNVVVLNKGIEFQESSATSVEMQLNENKRTNAEEFAKIFHISVDAIGGASADTATIAKLAAIPLMTAIQCALNRDLLLEKEKGRFYWAFDTKEMLKGDMKDRFEAYRTALEANLMQPDEVRFAEDMEPLGLNWIRLGLQDVLYDPKTKQIYTPNTNQTAVVGESSLQNKPPDDTIAVEGRANPNHDPANGRFTSGSGGSSGSGKKKDRAMPHLHRGIHLLFRSVKNGMQSCVGRSIHTIPA